MIEREEDREGTAEQRNSGQGNCCSAGDMATTTLSCGGCGGCDGRGAFSRRLPRSLRCPRRASRRLQRIALFFITRQIDPGTLIIAQRASSTATLPRNFPGILAAPTNLATIASRLPRNNCRHSLLSPCCLIQEHSVFQSLCPSNRRHVCSHHVAAAQLSLPIGVQTLAPRLRHQRAVHSSHFISFLFRVRGQYPVYLHLQLRAVPLSDAQHSRCRRKRALSLCHLISPSQTGSLHTTLYVNLMYRQ